MPARAYNWSADVHAVFKAKNVRQIGTVPDGGLSSLLRLCEQDEVIKVITLTCEDEGLGLLTGAWLGGERAALLIQSSGVGNIINALSLPAICRIPCFMLVTMRGQWGEFNGWQVPMGQQARPVLEAMGVTCYPAEEAESIGQTVSSAIDFSFHAGVAVAVLVGQKVIGAKTFGSDEVKP